jgi:hypothetical protein
VYASATHFRTQRCQQSGEGDENCTRCDCRVGSLDRNRRLRARRESDWPISMHAGLRSRPPRRCRLRHSKRVGTQPCQRSRPSLSRLGGLPGPHLDCPCKSRRDLFPGRHDDPIRQRHDLAAGTRGAAWPAAPSTSPVRLRTKPQPLHAGIATREDLPRRIREGQTLRSAWLFCDRRKISPHSAARGHIHFLCFLCLPVSRP